MSDLLKNPPTEVLAPPTLSVREQRQLEKSVLREALASVCEASVGEKGAKLTKLLEKVEEESGAKAAFECIMKMMEFVQPKLTRTTIEDPDGNALPIINVTFATPAPQAPPAMTIPFQEGDGTGNLLAPEMTDGD